MLRELTAVNYRSARELVLELGPVGAFIGEPGAGKSNVLAAVGALLFPDDALDDDDVRRGEAEAHVEAVGTDGQQYRLGHPDTIPGAIIVPAALRADSLLRSNGRGGAVRATELFEEALDRSPAPRVAFVHALEACVEEVSGVVFLVEEPELFLAPHGHRYLYRLFQQLAARGNQVLFTTHSPGLLNVSRLEEIHLVARDTEGVTTVERLESLDADDEFRALCEFDAARSELFFSRAVMLVEGLTEKVAFPYAFQAMGHDIDRAAISVVDCGGKTNLPLFIEICRRAHVPYVAVFDSDVRGHRRQRPEVLRLNRRLRQAAGRDRYVDLTPDFEGVMGIRGKSGKPERALRAIRSRREDSLPFPIRNAVELTMAAAESRSRSYS